MPTLEWIGKDKVINHHQEVPYRILDKKYTYNAESSENMIIHGDNLLALKSLLPQYEGRVDCIYIDPPYNTGNEKWVYNDNVNDPRIKKWLGEVVGQEGEDLSRHDKWLCMMYPRLKLMSILLKNSEGIMFISIDEHEIANLLQVCFELFGKSNVEVLIWRKNGKQGNTKKINRFKNTHEYIIVCYKNKYEKRVGKCKLMPNWKNKQTNADNDPRGNWASGVISRDEEHSDVESENYYSIVAPSGRLITREFYYSKDELERLIADNRIYFPKNGDGVPRLKIFEGEEQKYYFDSIIDEMGTFTDANAELKLFFGDSAKEFSTPKPSKIIRELVRASTDGNAIVLDAFAGTGTTGQAVLELNKEENDNRHFILIELMDYAEKFAASRIKQTINGYAGRPSVAGDFSYYELGEPLFKEDKNLNEEVGEDEIRKYVYYMETKLPLEVGADDNRYYMGKANDTAYYFYYEKDKPTTLNREFLSTVKTKASGYLIYADVCALPKETLDKNGIVFKKIPRDIKKL